jgi:RNA polymerase sigma factor (sigma-70 family)
LTEEPTVFVVDDDPGMRSSLRRLVSSVGLRVETFASAVTFLDAFDPARCGCIVSDVRMPSMSGLELQETLADRGARIPMIMVTGYADVPTAVRSMKAGAADFIEKPFEPKALLERIREALREDRAAKDDRERLLALRGLIDGLTEREREVMQLVVDGMTSRQIADRLGVSPKTIHFHRAELMRKMAAHSVAELTSMVVSLRTLEEKK